MKSSHCERDWAFFLKMLPIQGISKLFLVNHNWSLKHRPLFTSSEYIFIFWNAAWKCEMAILAFGEIQRGGPLSRRASLGRRPTLEGLGDSHTAAVFTCSSSSSQKGFTFKKTFNGHLYREKVRAEGGGGGQLGLLYQKDLEAPHFISTSTLSHCGLTSPLNQLLSRAITISSVSDFCGC